LLDEAVRRVIPVPKLERHDTAEAAHLAFRQFVLRMRFEARIVDRLHCGMPFEAGRNRVTVCIVLLHPQSECPDAA
ncbi:hypothetical protein NECAME_18733, partial [Necator americanus]